LKCWNSKPSTGERGNAGKSRERSTLARRKKGGGWSWQPRHLNEEEFSRIQSPRRNDLVADSDGKERLLKGKRKKGTSWLWPGKKKNLRYARIGGGDGGNEFPASQKQKGGEVSSLGPEQGDLENLYERSVGGEERKRNGVGREGRSGETR